MAEIIPFRGIRYNPEKVSLDQVTTPPYDVIDAAGQEDFYNKNDFNVIRLELGKKFAEDTEDDNRYTRAMAYLQEWLHTEILRHDDKPSVYLYEQEFSARGETKTRSGFIAGVRASGYSKGDVLPHEETLPKHKVDRLNLMKATLANFSPIFGLYADAEHAVEKTLSAAKASREPDGQVTDEQGVVNRLWAISDEETLETVIRRMAEKKIFIADGHHRYETAVNFGKEMAAEGKDGYDYLMVNLVNLYNEGLVVFPTHRVVKNLPSYNLENLLQGLDKNFNVDALPPETQLAGFVKRLETAGETAHAFGLYPGNNQYYIITLKNEALLENIADSHSLAWRRLDVSILHTLILEQLLGIGSQQRADESNLVYVRDEAASKEFVDSGSAQLAFFMNATKVEEVTNIALGGEKMPQKSTFFYPKVITGMVMNDYK